MKKKRDAEVVSVQRLASDVYDMWIKDVEIASSSKAGQFVSLYCNNESRLLPRPISICELNKEEGLVRFVYRVVGEGTREFSKLKATDKISILGPLGNGFTLEGKNVLIVGGGIGIPPLLELTKNLDGNKHIVLGFRNEMFLKEEFEKYGKVYISTEDGSNGVKGNVTNAINYYKLLDDESSDLKVDVIFTCGPLAMLRGLKEIAKENNIKIQISLEERMACGVGACLSCTCKTKEKDINTNVHNTRICKEGPVFYGSDIEI